MPDVQFQSALARKLSTFVSLSSDELECLADMQANQLKVRRGKQLTQEGQTEHQAFVLQTAGRAATKNCRAVAVRSSRSRSRAIALVCGACCFEQPIIPSRP